MARRFLCKAALAAMLGLGLGGLANAQSAYAPPPSAYPPPPSGYASPAQPVLLPVANQQPCPGAEEVVPDGDGSGGRRGHSLLTTIENLPHPVLDFVENHEKVGCWAHHNAFGCTSFPAEMDFIFGSCRSFFGQTCLKQPPPDELAPMRDGTPNAANPPRSRWPLFSPCPNCR